MIEAGHRRRTQPAPPHVVFDDLIDPTRDRVRPWLHLLGDEQVPTVLEARKPRLVVWSSLWPRRPEALIRFQLTSDGGFGTLLAWTLLVDEPMPDDSVRGHFRKRLNELINRDYRAAMDQ
ncbi:hypothetical protein [Paractinoplanes durhamensis]|uniref:hypothetical protein n=1 Tax=Paractinoplanes durhamensis TaxID=113563 RepID=UPI0019445BBA|nr:hypothetical protein [Actinoplanes durhamensis]